MVDETRIAVVSQGPTWDRFRRPACDYHVVVGVNSIPTRIECDYWAFSDWCSFGKWDRDVIGTPIICTRPERPAQILNPPRKFNREADPESYDKWASAGERFGRFKHMTHDDLRLGTIHADHKSWNTYSGPPALALARHLAIQHKTTRIDCFGCDMSGTGGVVAGGARRERRWRSERDVWLRVVGICEQAGIAVYRCDSEGVMVQDDPAGVDRQPPMNRRWQYAPPGQDWYTQVFDAPSEQAMRQFIIDNRGPQVARGSKIREVVVN